MRPNDRARTYEPGTYYCIGYDQQTARGIVA